MKITTLLLTLTAFLLSTSSFAETYPEYQSNSADTSVFFTFETSAQDHFLGIGIGTTFISEETNFGVNLSTSLSNAKVMTDLGFEEDFVAWEGHVKVGYFSGFSIYAEMGFDIGELLSPDFRQIDDLFFDAIGLDDDEVRFEKEIDSYIGIGAGFNFGELNISAFSRVRNINSDYWEATNDTFTGIQFSINF